MPLTQAEQNSLNNVNRGRELVLRDSYVVHPLVRRRQDADARLAAFATANPSIIQPDLRQSTFHWFYILAMVGAYLLDRALFSQALDELADQALPSVRYALPGVIVLFETMLGAARHRAQDHVYGQPSTSARLYAVMGFGLALVLPCLLAWTQLAVYFSSPEPDRSDLYMLLARIAGLTILSLVVHGFLVLSGADAHTAKAYVAGRIQHSMLRRRQGQANDAYTHGLHNLDRTFGRYEDVRQEHNRQYAHLHRDAGPFNHETINVLNRSRNATTAPADKPGDTQAPLNHPTAPVPPPPPPTVPTPQPGLHGNESEVTPL